MLLLNRDHQTTMITYVSSLAPEEACGLLIGKSQFVTDVIPISNQLHSPVRFMMDPLELLQALQRVEHEDKQLLAAFHSHPKGPYHPSPSDVAEFLYPGVYTIILSPHGGEWQMNVFDIHGGTYLKAEWALL